MLCKKCNKPIEDTEKICTNCGANIEEQKKGKSLTIIAVVFAIALVLAVAYYFSKKTDGEEIIDGQGSVEENIVSNGEGESFVEVEEPEILLPSEVPDLEKSIEEVWDLVIDVAFAAKEYHSKYNEQAVMISKNGYLFDVPADYYVKPETLLEVTEMNPEFADESVLIFYLKPDDLLEFKDLEVKGSDKLEVFAAYETNDGFIIASSRNGGGILPREDFSELLKKYDTNKGKVIRPTYSSDEYRSIVDTLKNHLEYEDIEVRYMALNDKYAIAIISPKDNDKNIQFYVLEKEDSTYKVTMENLEKERQFQVIINEKYPDLSYSLLPKFNLYSDLKFMGGSYNKLVEAIKTRGFVFKEDGEEVFVSGTNDFIYVEFESGKKILGFLNEYDEWEINPMSDCFEAEEFMNKIEVNAPTFILRQ